MAVLAKTFFPLVGSHLVTLMLLSVWHSPLVFRGSFYRELFHLRCEALGGLESGDVVLGDGDGRVLRDVAGDLLGAFLHDEAAESAEIHVVLLCERCLDTVHESLDDSLYLHLLNTGALSDFAYDICLCHIFD